VSGAILTHGDKPAATPIVEQKREVNKEEIDLDAPMEVDSEDDQREAGGYQRRKKQREQNEKDEQTKTKPTKPIKPSKDFATFSAHTKGFGKTKKLIKIFNLM
jgi:hypothetical protein